MSLYVDIEKKLGNFHLKVKFEAKNNVLALLGASGCGKSMTLKCIAGIEKPDRGIIRIDDMILFDSSKHINLAPQQRKVGYLFQQYALFPNMTVRQNIACGLKIKKIKNSAEKKQLIDEMIRSMHLEGCENKKPSQLSGGQQQRVALARILINEPDVLLLDEPFSALDTHLRFTLEREVREVITGFGKPVILVSHDRDEVFRLSDYIATVEDGTISAFGSRYEVFSDPKTVRGARLTGCKNISSAHYINDDHVFAGDLGISLKVSPKNSENKDITYIGIRMHDISLMCYNSEDAENTVVCNVKSELENPFSYTIHLVPENIPDSSGLDIELDKNIWEEKRNSKLSVVLPASAILLLHD